MKRKVPRDEFISKRMERQKKIRKRRLTAFFIIFIVLLLLVGGVLSLTVFFPIEGLNAKGSKIYSAEEILEHSGISTGDNLFAVNEAKTEKLLKSKLPYIETVDFKRELPGNLQIIVKDAVEFACYKSKEKYYTVSSTGWVLSADNEAREDIVNISATGVKCKVGKEIVFEDIAQKELVDNITSALKRRKININFIDTTDTVAITLRVENRFEVNLGTSNNIEEKISHLGGMIKEFSAEKQGKINLSMWTSDNKKGSFTPENQ